MYIKRLTMNTTTLTNYLKHCSIAASMPMDLIAHLIKSIFTIIHHYE